MSLGLTRSDNRQTGAAVPSFAGAEKAVTVQARTTAENPNAELYRMGIRGNYERLIRQCDEANLRKLGHAVGWMYINAHGALMRASKDSNLQFNWSEADDQVQNLVNELVSLGILTRDHFGSTELRRSGGMIPLDRRAAVERKFPEWYCPPETLGCPKTR